MTSPPHRLHGRGGFARAWTYSGAAPPIRHFGFIGRVADKAARLDAFASYGAPSIGAFASPANMADTVDLMAARNFDLLHIERSYCARLGRAIASRACRKPVLTLDLDEDDSRVYAALADLAGKTAGLYARRWNLLEAAAFRRLLNEVVPAFDQVWLASSVDKTGLGSLAAPDKVAVAPNAVASAGRAGRRDDGRTLLFVGSLGYAPNQDAVGWFLSAIWPRLSRARNVRFQIVGPDAPAPLRRLARQRGVEMPGWVADTSRYYAVATLAIAPIRVGAGTRIKLIETALHGVPAVATATAAEGLGLRHGQHLWLADTPATFIKAICEALDRPAERRRRADAARAYVTSTFARETTVSRLARAFAALL